jgi:hypothetical protein
VGAWSSDGAIVYLEKPENTAARSEQIYSIIRKDLKSGEERQILRSSKPGEHITCRGLSPDGKWLGLGVSPYKEEPSWFCVMPAAGGTIQHIAQWATQAFGAYFFWGPFENGALFEQKTLKDNMKGLSYLPSFESREMIKIDLEMPRINGLTFHPDGKTVAFNSIAPSEHKVWVMENYLPTKK